MHLDMSHYLSSQGERSHGGGDSKDEILSFRARRLTLPRTSKRVPLLSVLYYYLILSDAGYIESEGPWEKIEIALLLSNQGSSRPFS
jgi:hypothetical protein